uniref:Forkhead box protein O1-A-like n=1 Tax=Gouania willdenowi TaxID=441366 RepID=A0A8C5EI51_GOUWI
FPVAWLRHSRLEIDPDFEPVPRPRSCTWPLRGPEPVDPPGSDTSSPAPSVQPESGSSGEFISLGLLEEDRENQTCSLLHPPHPQSLQQPPGPQRGPRGRAARPGGNAWGNLSYADLITKAIESSSEHRLTLAQIYDWMVHTVPYFQDKGDSNSSAGWKNSIRHNLSLHSRFVRIQNEGTGKSSWWMLNPDGGKNGKSPRRRAASMDNSNKFVKSRGRAAKKKVPQGPAMRPAPPEAADKGSSSPGSQFSNWLGLGSPNSHSNEDMESWSCFRTRTSSDASTLSGHRSPFSSEQDDVVESEGHVMYPGGGVGTFPSLSEVTGSVGQRRTDNPVMENLLDNLNLLGSDSSRSPKANGPYRSSGLPSYPPYVRPPGFLKELLSADVVPPRDALASDLGRGRCPPPVYHRLPPVGRPNADQWTTSPQGHSGPNVGPQTIQSQGSMVPMTRLSSPPTSCLRTCTHTHRARSNDLSASYSFQDFSPHHTRSLHAERLPSDLDNVYIERFECDLESVLHDTLMDGGGLDFNFDAAAAPHGFPQRVKTTSHSWVSS